ncbi:MAG: DoxX family protein [Rhodospirillales bacterium]|nr:DoxX family protein [Rhodospirillales bacterium]
MSNQNINSGTAPLAALVLRVSLGVMFLSHGFILKYLTFTPAGTYQYFESIGYPGALAYVVIAAETLAGLALIIGFQTRLVAFAMVPLLIGAMMQHVPNGWVFSAKGGGWEYPLGLILASIVQGLLGGGALAISKGDIALPILPDNNAASSN